MDNSRISQASRLPLAFLNIAAGEAMTGSIPMSRTAKPDHRRMPIGAEADRFFRLGLMCSSGESVPADMVAAHKWFNIAGMRGSSEAVRLRCEIASELSAAEIAAAQRAARTWLTRH
jgi:TPR repeat protein